MRLAIAALAVLTTLPGAASQTAGETGGQGLVQAGDLVFRAGRGPEALAVSLASGAEMTHVGIVVGFDDRGRPQVVHAEPQGDGSGFVKAEPLARFAAPAVASEYEVWRPGYGDRLVRDRTIGYALAAARRRVPFDGAFEMSTGNALYCSELIVRALDNGNYRWWRRPQGTAVPLMPEAVVFPSSLVKMEGLTLVVHRPVPSMMG